MMLTVLVEDDGHVDDEPISCPPGFCERTALCCAWIGVGLALAAMGIYFAHDIGWTPDIIWSAPA
jgi:hypothetical protein